MRPHCNFGPEFDCNLTKPVCSYSQFFEKEAPYARSLKNFGKIGVIANHANKTIRGKLANCQRVAIFLGYPARHSNDTYQMWNIKME
jgi:hypothetical protein